MEDARDQSLIRKLLFHYAPLEHLKVSEREADVDARILPLRRGPRGARMTHVGSVYVLAPARRNSFVVCPSMKPSSGFRLGSWRGGPGNIDPV